MLIGRVAKKTGILTTVFFLCLNTAVIAAEPSSMDGSVSFGIGWERLHYEEIETDTGKASDARVDNMTAGIEGFVGGDTFFGGLCAIFPVIEKHGREQWTSGGKVFQQNELEYGWTRIKGFAGWRISRFFNPFAGLRRVEGKQVRTGFYLPEKNESVDATATERIKSWSVLLGVMGETDFSKGWEWSYRAEYFIPIRTEVTNSILPGFRATDRDGYAFELKSGIGRSLTDSLTIGLSLYAGRMRWEGSGWISFDGKQAKWPKNDTDYGGAVVYVGLKF